MLPVVDALARLIKTRLDELGWKQAELARRSGVHPATLSAWLREDRAKGTRGPDPKKLRAVALTLGIPVADVFEAAGRIVDQGLEPDEEERFLRMLRSLTKDGREMTFAAMQALMGHSGRQSE
jgi:transcriptional regulator with XRE-family HTH domain